MFDAKADDVRLCDLPLELIEREIEELAAQVNAGHARWLALVAEYDRRRGWLDSGCRSLGEWVSWRCGLNPRSAREHVRVARALPELPLIRQRFETGEFSYSKVRALTRIATPESEADLCELATHATAAQLERIVRATRRVTAQEAEEVHRLSYLRSSWDPEDGALYVEGKLPPEEGALFLQALEGSRDALHEERRADADSEKSVSGNGSAEPPASPPNPTNAEALIALSEAALARPPTGLPGGERYQVLLHIDASGADPPSIQDGPSIAHETARRLGCDASLVSVFERDGEPLSVGRRTRTIPTAIRRALLARDGRCQFPGCERARFVDAHHIHHWSQGGETSLANLVLLCRYHHRLVHEGGFSVSRAGKDVCFATPAGEIIPASPGPPRASPRELISNNRGRGHAIDHNRYRSGSGEKMDLEMCVNAALAADRSP
jgi:Domain of unknown function (DUF222)/HNH endonuclease